MEINDTEIKETIESVWEESIPKQNGMNCPNNTWWFDVTTNDFINELFSDNDTKKRI